MEGEQGMPDGLKGTVSFVDDAGQIHVNWENGRTLPVIPEIRITPRGVYLVKEDRMLRTPFDL